MTTHAAPRGRFGTAFDWLGIERAWLRTRGSSAVAIGIVDPLAQDSVAASVAAGRPSDTEPFSGVAPEARILPVRYSTGMQAQAFDLAHAIEYAVEMGADIVNVDQGADLGTQSTRRAIECAATRNALVVWAASGNAGPVDEVPPDLLR